MKPFYKKVCEGKFDESGACVICGLPYLGPDQSVEFLFKPPSFASKRTIRTKSCEMQIVQKIIYFGRCRIVYPWWFLSISKHAQTQALRSQTRSVSGTQKKLKIFENRCWKQRLKLACTCLHLQSLIMWETLHPRTANWHCCEYRYDMICADIQIIQSYFGIKEEKQTCETPKFRSQTRTSKHSGLIRIDNGSRLAFFKGAVTPTFSIVAGQPTTKAIWPFAFYHFGRGAWWYFWFGWWKHDLASKEARKQSKILDVQLPGRHGREAQGRMVEHIDRYMRLHVDDSSNFMDPC